MSYEAGTAFLQVVPSFEGVVDAIAEEFSRDGEIAAEVFKESFESAIRGLQASISIDTRPADERLAELEAEIKSLHESVGVDIDDADALAKVAFLKGVLADLGRNVDVNVGANLAAELDQISLAASGAGENVDGLGTDAEGAAGSLSDVLGPALAVAATALIPLAGLAAGGLATLPAVLAGVATGFAAIALSAGPLEFVAKLAFDPLVNSLKPLVDAAILPGVSAGLNAIASVAGALAPLVVTAAGGIGQFVSQLGALLNSGAGIFNLSAITQAGVGFMGQLAKAALDVVPALLTIGAQATPILSAIGSGVDNIAKAFAGWVAGGGFQSFVQWLKANGPSIVSDLSSVLKGFGSLAIVLEPLGKLVLDLAGALGRVVTFAAPILVFLSEGIAFIARWLTPIGQLITQADFFAQHWSSMWATVQSVAEAVWTWFDSNIAQPLINFFTVTFPAALSGIVTGWTNAWNAIQSAVLAVWTWIVANIFTPIGTFFTVTIPGWIATLVGFFEGIPGAIGGALSGLFGIITGAFGDVASWVNTHIIGPVVGFFSGIGDALGTALSDVASAIESPFKAAFNAIVSLWNSTVGGFGFTIPGWVPFVGGDSFKIPDMHTGGIVPGPPGADVPIIMQAGELVIPRSGVASIKAATPLSTASPPKSLTINQAITAFDPRTAAVEMQQRSDFAAKTRGF